MIEKTSKTKAFSSLRNRNFSILWVNTLMANNGMQMIEVARGWLVYTMTDSALALGLVAAGMGIPLIVFSALGGVVADRVEKKNLIFVTQSCLGVVNLVLAILITTQLIALWHLVVASVLMGIIFSFSMPTRQAFIVELVTEDELTRQLLAENDILLIGRPRTDDLLRRVPSRLDIGQKSFTLDGSLYDKPSDAFFGVFNHPFAKGRSVALFMPLSPEDADIVAAKITHYGKYSYLVFQNGTNRDKGFWPVEASPLVFQWHERGE